ncbi:hypothetical protein N2152v2_004374 [Parachlorella kessleri]
MACTGGGGRKRTSFALLPHGVVSYIYGAHYKNNKEELAFVIGAKDRLRGLAVCKAWRAELAGSPLPVLLVEGPDHRGEDQALSAALEWAALARPRIQRLVVETKGFWTAKMRPGDDLDALERQFGFPPP